MSNQEILQKAIEKAKANGWSKPLLSSFCQCDHCDELATFSHDFAKAFWGEAKERCIYCGIDSVSMAHYQGCPCSSIPIKVWQFHLQQMVISEEPVKYLEKFLD